MLYLNWLEDRKQVFPSGGGGGLGDPHELYIPLITAVSPPTKSKNCPPIFVIMTKVFLKYFSIFEWQRLIGQAQQV